MLAIQVGLDAGTSKFLAYLDGGAIQIPAIVGDTEGAWEYNRPDYIAVEHEGRMKFVGQAALAQSGTKLYPMKDNKLERKTVEPLLYATMASIAHKYGDGCELDIVATLPFDADENQKEILKQMLEHISSRRIKCIINGMSISPHVRIKGINIKPEGLAAYLNYVLDDYGKIRKPDWAGKRVLVGDIGLYHLNLVVIDELRIIGRPISRSFPLGLSVAHQAIARKRGGIPLYEIDRLIRKGDKSYTTEAFQQLADLINVEVDNVESRTGSKFDGYYWTGGGSAAIFKYLNQSNKVLAKNPVMDNAQGAKKIATALWHKVE